jgi:hypothetical protein
MSSTWTKYSFLFNVNHQGIKITAYLHLFPRLRMSGAVPLLVPYSFMVFMGRI